MWGQGGLGPARRVLFPYRSKIIPRTTGIGDRGNMSQLLAIFSVTVLPVAIVWTICASSFLAMLRAFGLASPPLVPPCDLDMSSRVVIVTGANSGIGNRTAFHLARMGAKVIMACRSTERGERARAMLEKELRESRSTTAGKVKADTPAEGQPGTKSAIQAGTLEVMHLDLSSLESVRAFARAFEEKHGGQLDVLVNNAGIAAVTGDNRLTADGLDLVFGGNFIGHFALTTELMPLIQSTPAARVVCLSSVTHHMGCTEWEAAAGGHVGNWRRSTYFDSKLAMVLLAKELRRRFAAAGSSATAFSVNPGGVDTNIFLFVPKSIIPVVQISLRLLFLGVDEGCRTSVCASALPLKSLSDSDYYQPYWLPFGCPIPCEAIGPFVGCAPGNPTVPKDEPAASAEMWAACERIIKAAGAARADGPGAVRG